jgi:hypothetical protein
VPADRNIGYDLSEAREHFHVSPSGLVVIPKDAVAVAAARFRQVS